MIPFHCDVLLPTDQRYRSRKFRTFYKTFDPYAVDYGDALELVAFLGVVQPLHASWMFHGKRKWRDKARILIDHLAADAALLIQENLRNIQLDDGLNMLHAMQDGGWQKGTLPEWTRMSLIGLRDQGLTASQIAEAVGLRVGQVQNAWQHDAAVARRAQREVDRTRAIGMLGFS